MLSFFRSLYLCPYSKYHHRVSWVRSASGRSAVLIVQHGAEARIVSADRAPQRRFVYSFTKTSILSTLDEKRRERAVRLAPHAPALDQRCRAHEGPEAHPRHVHSLLMYLSQHWVVRINRRCQEAQECSQNTLRALHRRQGHHQVGHRFHRGIQPIPVRHQSLLLAIP